MSNTSVAVILEFNSLYPKAQAINFSYPFDDGIRVLGFDDILGHEGIYYGDEIDLKFWKLLRIPFGQSNDPENPLTLQEGYLYKYYHKTKIFDVFDNNGTRIIHKTDVRTIAQMNIDFTIHKSHQFWIITDTNIDGHIFMFPAILKKIENPINVEEFLRCGVQNIYLPDRVRPYLPEDLDNPSWNIKYLALYDEMQRWGRFDDSPLFVKFDEQLYSGIGDYNLVNWSKNCPTNYFYMKKLYEFEVINVPQDVTKVPPFDPTRRDPDNPDEPFFKPGDFVRGDDGGGGLDPRVVYKVLSNCTDDNPFIYVINNTKRVFNFIIGKQYYVNDIIMIEEDDKILYYLVKVPFVLTDWEIDIVNVDRICYLLLKITRLKTFTFFAEKLWLLYMQLGIGLYPDLMPILRYDETQNNRPIYEPWLIWGFYKFLWNKKTDDWGDDEIPPLFDLSPSFA